MRPGPTPATHNYSSAFQHKFLALTRCCGWRGNNCENGNPSMHLPMGSSCYTRFSHRSHDTHKTVLVTPLPALSCCDFFHSFICFVAATPLRACLIMECKRRIMLDGHVRDTGSERDGSKGVVAAGSPPNHRTFLTAKTQSDCVLGRCRGESKMPWNEYKQCNQQKDVHSRSTCTQW